MDDGMDALAGALAVGVFGIAILIVIGIGWVLYKISEAIVRLVQEEWARYQQEQWERARVQRMLQTHEETIQQIDDTVSYYVELQQFASDKAAEVEAARLGA